MSHNIIQREVIQKDTKSLRPHKLRRHFPAIDKEAGDWIALTDSVGAGGIQQPLLITADGFIVDGVWRWESAKDWQFAQVPCQVVPEELAAVIIAESLVCRKQMTRGATVYLMMPIIQEIVTSAEFRRLENLKAGRKTNEIELKPQHFSMSSNWTSGAPAESVRGLCFRWGIGKTTFYSARQVYAWLNEGDFAALRKLHADMGLAIPSPAALRQLQEDLREDFEPALLTGEKNLWNVESGIKGRLTGGEHQPPQQQLELFGSALESLATRAARFNHPAGVAAEVRSWLAALEQDMVERKGRPDEFRAKLESLASATKMTHDVVTAHLAGLLKKAKAGAQN